MGSLHGSISRFIFISELLDLRLGSGEIVSFFAPAFILYLFIHRLELWRSAILMSGLGMYTGGNGFPLDVKPGSSPGE